MNICQCMICDEVFESEGIANYCPDCAPTGAEDMGISTYYDDEEIDI